MITPITAQWPDDIAILIPAYKAARHLPGLLNDLIKIVPATHILVVDDASGDATQAICGDAQITSVVHPINQGKGGALKNGFAQLSTAGYRWIITMDADGQHRPEDLAAFVKSIKEHPTAGIIAGNRNKSIGAMPLARIFSNRLTSWIMGWYCGQKIEDVQCGYRAYSTGLINAISIVYNRFEMESEVVLRSCRIGMPVFFIPIQTVYSPEIGSHISHLTDTIRWVKAVISVSHTQRRKQTP